MEKKNTLVLFFEEISGALEPLAEAIESFDNFELYIREMGWSVSTIPPFIQSIATPINNILDELASGDLSVESIPEFVDLLRSVVEAINEIKNASASDLPPIVGFANEFPQQLLDRTIVDFLLSNYPTVGAFLRFFGIIKLNAIPASIDRLAYLERKINWTAIANFVQDPLSTLDAAYAWKTAFDPDKFLANLRDLMSCWGVVTRSGTLPDSVAVSLFGSSPEGGIDSLILQLVGNKYTNYGNQLGFYVTPTPGSSGLAIVPYAEGEIGAKIDIDEELAITIKGEATLNGGFAILFHPTQSIQFLALGSGPAAEIDTAVMIGLEFSSRDDEPRLLFGTSEGSRFEFQSASVRLGGEFSSSHSPVAVVETALQGGKLVIDLAGADGFLSDIVPADAMTFETNLSVGLNSSTGFYFAGSGGLEVAIPAHVDLGVLEIDSALFALKFKDGSFVFDIGATFKADLSTLKATVENMGVSVKARFVEDGRGNVGPLDFSTSFKPPNGVSLAIDAGVVVGGGYLYFDFEKEEYAGALELTFSDFLSLNAIGLISTRMPDSSKGFSLIVIIAAEFTIQLGYGFVFLGAGGLLGLNRTMKLEPLAEGVRTGATANIMFPTNIVENAPQIISDLKVFFPIEEGIFLIGPMAKLGWGTPTLISISLGIVIEIRTSSNGGIERIAILGVLKCILPDEEAALLVLQVNFIGAIDFQKKNAFFFASIFDSRVLFITIEGEMGVLVAWGNDANFVVSVGGFHPRFNPPPLPFPVLKRVSLNILNKSWGKIRVEGYFAVTTNTAQFGSKIEVYFGFSKFKIEGHLAFDALFQFNPFYFIVEISGKVSLKVFGAGLFSISLKFSLEGISPWRAKGYGKVKILFITFKAKFNKTWGEKENTQLPPIKVIPILMGELDKTQNWQAITPAANHLLVIVRDLPEKEGDNPESLVLHPVGTIRISQRAVPLKITLDKVGNQKPEDVKKLDFAPEGSFVAINKIKENFARAQFQNMKDSKKLSSPAYEKEVGGYELSVDDDQTKFGKITVRHVRYELISIDSAYKRFKLRFFSLLQVLFVKFLANSAVSKSKISYKFKKEFQPFDDKIDVMAGNYTVAFTKDNTPYNTEATNFSSQASAEEYMNSIISNDPMMADSIHAIPNNEVNI